MIQLLYGKNSFQLSKYVDEVIQAFLGDGGSKDEIYKVRVDEEAKPEELLISMQNVSLFATKKLTIVFDISSNSEVAGKLEQLCESADDDSWLCIVDGSLQARSKIVSFVQKRKDAEVKKADALKEYELSQWAVQYASDIAKKSVLRSGEAVHLVQRVGVDQELVAREVEKLVHGLGEGEQITKDYIDSLVELTPQGSVFAMLDAMLVSNSERAMEIYAEQIAQGSAPQQIIGMIVWQLTQLAIVVDSARVSNKELTDTYGVSSFAVSKLRPVAQTLTNKDIGIIVKEVMDADYQSRTTASADDAVEYIVSFISSYVANKKTAAHASAV